MIDTQDYIDYFHNLATHHKKIKDGLDGEKRFSPISMEDLINMVNHDLTFHPENGSSDYGVMVLEQITGQVRGQNTGNLNDEADGSFTILKHCPHEDFARELAIYKECKVIAFSVLGTMTRDYEANTDNIMQYFEPENGIRYQKVGPVFDNCFGIRVEFGFKKSMFLKHNDADYDV